MVLPRGRPQFLTQIERDLTLILTSHIKVRKVSSFGQYMYSEYIRVVQIEKERVWIFNAEICALNIHPRRLSLLRFVDLPRWSCFVLFCFFAIVLFQFNFVILSYSVMIVTYEHLFSDVAFSFQRWSLFLITTWQFYLS